MNFLNPPAAEYKDLVERNKFSMTWYVTLLLIPLFTFLVSVHLLSGDPNIFTTGGGLLLSVGSVLYLYFKREYKLVTFFSVLLGTFFCQYSIYVIADSHIVSDLMWVIFLTFYSFYFLGNITGMTVLTINILGLIIYMNSGAGHVEIHDQMLNFKTTLNVSIVAFVMAFLIHKIVHSTEKANNELQEANERLLEQNNEKTILLKEIHHRVKNNLQLISSLLKLQSMESANQELKDQFEDAINRIKSMALIHEKMYRQHELAKIDLQEYIEMLVDDIVYSNSPDKKISTQISSEITHVNIDKVVPLALLINELITNSLKHAFGDKEQGNISISLTKDGDQTVIKYADNGTWVEPNKEFSFGVELIDTLCDQLDAEYQRDVENGTTYTIECQLGES